MDEHRVIAHIYNTFNGIIDIRIDEYGIDINFLSIWDAFGCYDDLTDYSIPAEDILFWQDEDHKKRFSVGVLREHYELYMVEKSD